MGILIKFIVTIVFVSQAQWLQVRRKFIIKPVNNTYANQNSSHVSIGLLARGLFGVDRTERVAIYYCYLLSAGLSV